jgi:hypothetical protein
MESAPSHRPSGMFGFIVVWLVGTGPGAGMGLLLVICGVLGALVGLAGYFIPAIYNAETILPDHDQLQKVEAGA